MSDYNSSSSYGEEPVSVGEWLLTTLIFCIPLIGLIMMFVWAFGSGAKRSKSNYCKAALIWACIGIVITFAFGAMLIGIFSSMMSYY